MLLGADVLDHEMRARIACGTECFGAAQRIICEFKNGHNEVINNVVSRLCYILHGRIALMVVSVADGVGGGVDRANTVMAFGNECDRCFFFFFVGLVCVFYIAMRAI